MAVYKPTNCQPYLTTLDLLECTSGNDNYSGIPTVFECKVDTSNTKVTAYAITLYNSDNTQIFPVDTTGNPVEPQDNITFISDLAAVTGINVSGNILVSNTGYNLLNSGINGSYLRIPVFVDSGTSIPNSSTLSFNTLFVSSSGTVRAKSRGQTELTPVMIENGQQYKWVITLFQGVQKGSGTPPDAIFPTSIYEYDMIVTTGQVMGSNIERIQSYLSEEIYVDYYVQPLLLTYNNSDGTTTPVTIHVLDETEGTWEARNNSGARLDWEDVNTELVGDRVLIKNYDSSYGYIYPTTGDYGFPEGLISKGQANAFQIYSMSNNAEDLTTVRMVSVVPYTTIPWSWVNMEGSQGSSYAQQVYYVLDTQNSIPDIFYPFETTYAGASGGVLASVESAVQNRFVQSGTGNIGITAQTRIVLNYQAELNTVSDGEEAVNWYAHQIENIPDFGNGDSLTVDNCDTEDVASPFNGIYTPSFSVDSRTQINGQYYRRVTVNWRRASDADAWGELSTKIVKVTSTYPETIARFGGKNIQTQKYEVNEDNSQSPVDDSTVAGTLNQTPLKFIDEKPLTIYSHTLSSADTGVSLINNTGIILYNDDPDISASASDKWPDDGTLATLYIRPYVGIEPEMWIRELGTSENTSRFFLVKEVNTTTWAVKYDPYNVYVGKQVPSTSSGEGYASSAIFEIGQRYQIRTFYKSSDENPFNLYSNPDISMTFYPSDWIYDAEDNPEAYKHQNEQEGTGPIVIGSRSFVVSATYAQNQYIWWKSFNYTLYDMIGNQLSSSGDKYNGLMQHTFYGLSRGDYYNLVLTVETYSGNVISLSQELICSFEPSEIGDEFPFNLSFDCDINAARMTFRLTGYIIPNVELEGGGYRRVNEATTSNDTLPSIPGVTYSDRGSMLISYNDAATSKFPEEGVTYTHAADGTTAVYNINPLKSENNTVLVQSSHTVRNENFTGNFISVYFEPDDDSSSLPSEYKLVVYIPEELMEEENGLTVANPDRNKVLYDILGENGESAINGPAVANLYSQTGAVMTDNKWQNDKYILANWQPAIAAISENLGSASLVDYKPVTQRLSEETSEGLGYDSTQGAVLGAFNTTSDYEQRISGQNPVRVPIAWWVNSPQRQFNPMMADNTSILFAQGDPPQPPTATEEKPTPSPSDTNDDLCYVGIETKHRAEVAGLDRELFTVRGGADNFVIVNKTPVVWGDYNFTIGIDYGTSQNTSFWNIASIHQVAENDSDQTVIVQGFKTRSYFENRESPFIWNDTSSDESGNNTRWFDGWGYNNGGDSNQIYVGNQTQVTDADLTNTERSNIKGKTFVIQANVGIEPENNQLIHEVSVYYQNN